GSRDRPPLKMWGHQAQMIAGGNVFAAAMTTLTAARGDGAAHHADVSVFESVLQFLHSVWMKWSFEQQEVGRDAVAAVANGVYPCADGYAGIIVTGTGLGWRRMKDLMGEERLGDERFRTLRGRVKYGDEIDAYMLPWIISHGKEEIYHAGQAVGLPFASVRSAPEVVNSEHLLARNFFDEVEHPGLPKMPLPGPPVRISSLDWVARPAPRFGEHTEAVLNEAANVA